MKSPAVCEQMNAMRLPGVMFHDHPYQALAGQYSGQIVHGVRMVVLDPSKFLPITTAVSILFCLQHIHGRKRIWNATGTRPEFFDRLFGTDTVRKALLEGESPGIIAGRWARDIARFRRKRRPCLLYRPE